MGTSTITLEAVRERIRANFPKEAQSAAKRQKLLTWDRENASSIISSCGVYRISKLYVKDEDCEGYVLSLRSTPTSAPRHLSGPFLFPRDARDAAQRHADGEPLQADLS